MNDRLRTAMLQRGVSPQDLAETCQVDPKTVDRWINPGRVPHRRHRWKTSQYLRVDESDLWPDATDGQHVGSPDAEVVQIYPRRALVPHELWRRLFEGAAERIDVLVYAGLFLPEQYPNLPELFLNKTHQGVAVRLLFGNPEAPSVLERSHEEGIGDAIPFKIRNTLVHYRSVFGSSVEIRLHGTTLYNSLYRFDDQILVNAHVYGLVAAHAPVLHLRRQPGGQLFDIYADSFERVWSRATPTQAAMSA